MRLMLAATAPVVSAIATLPSDAHACRFSSNKKIRDRHELVKAVRVDAIRTAGYDDIKVEPRLTTASQRRADIFYVDRSSHKHIHYYTDDRMTWCATPCVSLTLRVRSSTPSRLSVRLKE